jgi:hypothetical protein
VIYLFFDALARKISAFRGRAVATKAIPAEPL